MFIPNKIIFNSHNAMLEHIKKGYSKEKCITIHNGYERLSKFHKPKIEKNFFKNDTFNILPIKTPALGADLTSNFPFKDY